MSSDPRPLLINAANHFYQRGWMAGTGGNLSARIPDGSLWITASGRPKGQLTPTDFIRMSVGGHILEQPRTEYKPSAETSIHLAVYQTFPEAQACYHIHSIEAKLVSRFTTEDYLALPPIEMIKVFGIWEESPKVLLPLFPNYLEVPKIAQLIIERFQANPPGISALLIRDHGVTVWANSQETAYNHVETIEYIFRYMVTARQMQFQAH